MADQDSFNDEFDETDAEVEEPTQPPPSRVPLLARPVRAVFPPAPVSEGEGMEDIEGEEAREPAPKLPDPTSGDIPEAGLTTEAQDDVLGVSDEDIMGESPTGDPFDMSDVLTVSNEDIMGKKPTPRAQKYRRTSRPYPSSPQLGGLR